MKDNALRSFRTANERFNWEHFLYKSSFFFKRSSPLSSNLLKGASCSLVLNFCVLQLKKYKNNVINYVSET